MVNESQALPIAAIVVFAALPFPLALFAVWLAGRAASHVWAKRLSLVLPTLGVAFCIWFFYHFRISKFPETDFMFGLVLLLWLAAIGGILGGIIDRVAHRVRRIAG